MAQQTEQMRQRRRAIGHQPPSSRPHPGPGARRRWPAGLAGLAGLLILAAGLGPGPDLAAAAQDSAGCAIPERRAEVAAPAETPDPIVIAPVRRGVSTPVAEIGPAATPAATPDPLAPLRTELEAVVTALAACLSDGDAELVSTLATERYLGQLYGGDTPLSRADYLALAAELDPIPTRIRSVTNIRREGDDRATAEVTSVVGRQLLVSRWSFVQAPAEDREADQSRWQMDHEEPLPFDPPADATTIDVTISDYEFGVEATPGTGADVVLSGRNSGSQDHEMLVLRLDDGVTTNDLLRGAGPGLPEGVTYVGQATIPTAARTDLTLVDLEPGTYTVVCFFLTPEGIPHLALGMEATFTIEE